jgi:hypothetical protein
MLRQPLCLWPHSQVARASQRFVCVLWWSLSSDVILHKGPRFGPEFQRLRLLVCKRAARNRYG